MFEHSPHAGKSFGILAHENRNYATDPTQEARYRMLSALSKCAFTLLKANSIGIKVGRNRTEDRSASHPPLRSPPRRQGPCAPGRLSIKTVSPRLSIGTRHCFTQARNIGPFMAPSSTNGATISRCRRAGNEGDRFPMFVRRVANQPFAAQQRPRSDQPSKVGG
jgi:hypothetical protein